MQTDVKMIIKHANPNGLGNFFLILIFLIGQNIL